MRIRAILAAMVCALVTGCTDSSTQDGVQDVGENASTVSRTSSVEFVCVGMEKSARFGACPGCKLDSDRMNAFLKEKFGYEGILLQSEQATRQAVSGALRDAVGRTPVDGLFIFYYSGHGGQEYLGSSSTEEPEGADADDEYLCLYDSYLLDDEIWEIISKCRGRVFMCVDACHSQTMYRSVSYDIALDRGLAVPLDIKEVKSRGFELKPRAIALEAATFGLLCWSGCLEAEYSFGSSRGGVMTNSILKRWKAGISYESLFSQVKYDVNSEQPTQHPASTKIGAGFSEAFR